MRKFKMRDLLDKWRYYGMEEGEYKKCMNKIFARNIHSLRRTNAIVIIILSASIVVPFFTDRNFSKTIFYIGACVIAALLYLLARQKLRHEGQDDKGVIYTLILLSYANISAFGIYLGVWANPGMIAGSFLGILICALLLFYIPAVFYFCLTICSMIAFMVIVVIFKSPDVYKIDIPNAFFAGIAGIVIGWQVIMNRLALASYAGNMEDERDNYYHQSTIDELTQLKNRRDFRNTFHRFLTSFRQSDKFLCVAILDIDYFKNYNDYYGHLKGDECLRKIGWALKNLHNNKNIYAARIGGEEFALIWFEEDIVETNNVAAFICEKIRSLNIRHEKSCAAPYVTVSVGVNVSQCGDSYDMDTLYNLADKALYTAKKKGRNCVVINTY
jgi:diguanylate cyclase (GGDEF)-like protein